PGLYQPGQPQGRHQRLGTRDRPKPAHLLSHTFNLTGIICLPMQMIPFLISRSSACFQRTNELKSGVSPGGRAIMSDTFDQRPSDSPFVTRVVLSRAESDGVNVLPADGNCYMFLQTVNGKTSVAIGGPLTKVMALPVSQDTEWIGVRFALGAFLPDLPPGKLLDNVAFLPVTGRKTFWLDGSSWEFPTFENF